MRNRIKPELSWIERSKIIINNEDFLIHRKILILKILNYLKINNISIKEFSEKNNISEAYANKLFHDQIDDLNICELLKYLNTFL